MPVTCNLVKEAAQGLSNGATISRLISALGALAAVDTAIQIGSGGSAGLLDLPGLFNEKGIECYSPELGDSIWVTPLQWYANGMKCDGLRDPDREALKKFADEADEKKRASIKQGSSNYPIPNVDIPPEYPGTIPNFNQGFPGETTSVIFDKKGELKVESSEQSGSLIWWTWLTPAYPLINNSFKPPKKEVFEIKPGDRIIKRFTSSPAEPRPGFTADGITVPTLNGGVFEQTTTLQRSGQPNVLISRQFFSYRDSLDRPWFWGNFKKVTDVSTFNKPADLKFKPEEPKPKPPWVWNPKYNPDIEDPCKMGCSCKDINALVRQSRQTDQSLRRLIEEIHRATAAGFFRTAQQFSPEQRIEQMGKQIYAQSPGRGGKVPVSNLLDATAALIAAEYHRLGLHKFPANVSKNLIPDPNAAVEAVDRDFIDLQTLADFLEWQVRIDDERLGEWPVKIEVDDDGKTKIVPLLNIAEALGDIYGALIKVVEDSDISVQWGIRSAIEASKAGNAGLKTLHLLKELVQFSGALTGPGFIKVDSTFTPNVIEAGTQEDMLKPSKQDLEVTEIVDKRSLLGLLLNISYWSQISGRAVFGDLSNNPATGRPNMPGDGIKEMRRRTRIFDKRWDEWRRKRKQRRNIPTADQPPGGEHPPDIKDISAPR